MGYPPEKPGPVDEEELQQRGEQTATGWNPVSQHKVERMRDQDTLLKKNVRRIRLAIRLATLALSIFTLYTQAVTLYKYLSTRDTVRSVDGTDRTAWSTTTVIWPTVLLLISSSATILISLITLAGYAWSVKHANWASSRIGGPVVVAELAAHLAIWIGTAIAYRVGKTGNDLWGWSCSTKADEIQVHFAEVNFGFFCDLQSNAWAVSLAQVVLFIITCLGWGLAWRRIKHKENLKRRETLLAPLEYQNNPFYGRNDENHPYDAPPVAAQQQYGRN